MSKDTKKGEIIMNASAVKSKLPFATRKDIERTPATAENRKRVEFMDL